ARHGRNVQDRPIFGRPSSRTDPPCAVVWGNSPRYFRCAVLADLPQIRYVGDCSTAYNRAASSMTSQPGPLLRPPRGTAGHITQGTLFVGRKEELARLRGAFESAVRGHGSIVLLVGEPGVGKTALTEQFLEFAIERQARTLVGHCYDTGGVP